MAHRILVADDDPHIREVICFALEKAGMQVHAANDGASALRQFEELQPSLIVLDVGMPQMDGLEVCRQIRRISDVPILFLSARDEEIDRVLGLEMGGDDYVTKPFSPRELVARVNVILRRGRKEEKPEAEPLVRGLLRLDIGMHEASFGERPVQLTAIEFAMLKTLMAAGGRVLNRDQIMQAAYPGNIHVSDRTIDSHVRNLRGKLKEAGCEDGVETVHGVGLRIGRCGA
ncbi:MAG: response regulator transcription factor [Hyphomicrobiales bacterium]|nr:response regulator transcription factor [Hyphomicrobiales bacterium]